MLSPNSKYNQSTAVDSYNFFISSPINKYKPNEERAQIELAADTIEALLKEERRKLKEKLQKEEPGGNAKNSKAQANIKTHVKASMKLMMKKSKEELKGLRIYTKDKLDIESLLSMIKTSKTNSVY